MITSTFDIQNVSNWSVRKIGVIGPGIVGMPMAALLAHAKIEIGSDQPAKVHVVQRNSTNSGWKVDAINSGQTVIGGIEPGLDDIVKNTVANGLLTAGHSCDALADADVILVAIQTDKNEDGIEPDYGPLLSGLSSLATALKKKPAHTTPLIIFESTLAPSTMATVIRDHFKQYNLIEGKDILLGNSPNRVMPGRLVERVADSDKLAAGLHPVTPTLISTLYKHIVTGGVIYETNSMTAEVVKTLENAYRDVRIAFSAEIAGYCDQHNINFYTLRDQVNQRLGQTDNASTNPNCVPSGGLLIPTVGVGGHCLPKDGILLLWRQLIANTNYAINSNSIILKSREINDGLPAQTIALLQSAFGDISGTKVAILGTAYRFNSEDTRNSPSIQLALQLLEMGCQVVLHDPYVKPDDQNLLKFKVDDHFTRDIQFAIKDADFLIFATAHRDYSEQADLFREEATVKGIVDGCNLFSYQTFQDTDIGYTGIGRGLLPPPEKLIDFAYESFRTMERGLANEIETNCEFLNSRYADSTFNTLDFNEVRRLAASCSTGCDIAEAGQVHSVPKFDGFQSQLALCAWKASRRTS